MSGAWPATHPTAAEPDEPPVFGMAEGLTSLLVGWSHGSDGHPSPVVGPRAAAAAVLTAESGMAAPEIRCGHSGANRYLPLLYNALTSASDSARS